MSQVRSIKALEQFVKDNWDWFFFNGLEDNFWRRCPTGKHTLINFKINVGWDYFIRNSHSCPRNGVENWGSRIPGAPTSYPGFRGIVSLGVRGAEHKQRKESKFHDAFGSSYFKKTTINIGSGGGSGKDKSGVCNYSYGVNLFAADFPGLVEAHEKSVIWNKLSGEDKSFSDFE